MRARVGLTGRPRHLAVGIVEFGGADASRTTVDQLAHTTVRALDGGAGIRSLLAH